MAFTVTHAPARKAIYSPTIDKQFTVTHAPARGSWGLLNFKESITLTHATWVGTKPLETPQLNPGESGSLAWGELSAPLVMLALSLHREEMIYRKQRSDSSRGNLIGESSACQHWIVCYRFWGDTNNSYQQRQAKRIVTRLFRYDQLDADDDDFLELIKSSVNLAATVSPAHKGASLRDSDPLRLARTCDRRPGGYR